MALAPRTPSSAGWKTKRMRPQSASRLAVTQRASVRPVAACMSWPQECMRPGRSDAKPRSTGRRPGSSDSETHTQSISKRKTVRGPGRPVSIVVAAPVQPSSEVRNASGTPASSARLCAASTLAASRPITASGSMRSAPVTTSQPMAFRAETTVQVDSNSVQPSSGRLCRRLRQSVKEGGGRPRCREGRGRGRCRSCRILLRFACESRIRHF